MRTFRLILVALACATATRGALAAQSAANAASPPSVERMIPLARVKKIIAHREKIVSPHGIQQQFLLPIGGIRQWISIRGHDLRNPILLVLHGGPGSPEAPAAWTFQSPWEDYFTVVEWAQRGTGKTYAANSRAAMAPGMTINGMAHDAAELVQYLRHRFGKKKIFLMGHSFGTVLGVTLAQRHPDWFYAYIGVGQIVNFRRGEHIGYEWALKQARDHHNAEAVKELTAIAPYPGKHVTIAHVGVRSKWEMYYGGLAWGRKDFSWDSDTWRLSPEYSERDLKAIDAGSLFSLEHLLPQLMAVNFDHVTDFKCPVIMFVGAHDYTTPHTLITHWFARLQAPSKKLVVFADSAHMIMEEQPGRFLVHLVTDALPYARKAGDVAPDEETRGAADSGESRRR
ncbi:MAG: alpha/beta hydrolase [Alphaproteobacteria bacterium]|nr:alpha/beta hydrolase [Alphaproteobacteria bacterium]